MNFKRISGQPLRRDQKKKAIFLLNLKVDEVIL